MPSTHVNLLCHIIFATKDRTACLDASWRHRLFEYLGGVAHGLNARPLGIGGVADHVHLLISLKATHRLSDVVRDLKKSSSSWVRETIGQSGFQWQEGYAALSVSASAKESVRAYIAEQAEHHRTKPFREELVEFLLKSGVEFDERYLD
jgi:REP-associated tyrosine transposase